MTSCRIPSSRRRASTCGASERRGSTLRVTASMAIKLAKATGTSASARCSARPWLAALSSEERSTIWAMASMRASPGAAVTLTTSSPSSSAVPEKTDTPGPLCTKVASPVMDASLTSASPETTTPSTASTMPVLKRSRSSQETSSVATRTSPSSVTFQSVAALATSPCSRASRVRLDKCSCMRSDSCSRNMIVSASPYDPRSTEATKAVASSTSTVSWQDSRCRMPSATNRDVRRTVKTARNGAGSTTRRSSVQAARPPARVANRSSSRRSARSVSSCAGVSRGRCSTSNPATHASTASRASGANKSRSDPLATCTWADRTPSSETSAFSMPRASSSCRKPAARRRRMRPGVSRTMA